MNRILKLLTGSLLGLFLLLPFSRVFALAPIAQTPSDLTNGCLYTNAVKTFSAADTSEAPNSGAQNFIATKNRITKVTAYMKFSAINTVQFHLMKTEPWDLVQSSQVFDVTNESGYTAGHDYSHSFNLNATVVPGEEYAILLVVTSGTANWRYIENDGSCDATGRSAVNLLNGLTTDMTYMVQGYNYTAPAPATPGTTTNKTNPTVPTTTVAPSVLAVPANFRLDRDINTEMIFAWDKNTEATLTGYVMYVYDGETLVETIDIPDKELDNYNIILADHPLLVKDKEYTVKLSAKTATAVSEKSGGVKVTFADAAPEVTVIVEEAKSTWITNPYVLGGLGLLFFLLLGLLVFLEKKYHGLGKLFKGKVKPEVEKPE